MGHQKPHQASSKVHLLTPSSIPLLVDPRVSSPITSLDAASPPLHSVEKYTSGPYQCHLADRDLQ